MADFNDDYLEKRLLALKDTQESISGLSSWCLQHPQHHKKIVTIWLQVLKKVKIEQRLTLFHLANDVIQYSKRKNFDFVESWGTALQKATTMVRDDKVKNKILRLFKIWHERTIYDEAFLVDLSGLLMSSRKPAQANLEAQDFQPSVLISKITSCKTLEEDTDLKLKTVNDSHLSLNDADALHSSLKDRRHGSDLEHELEEGVAKMMGYINALKAEIKERKSLIEVLDISDSFYENQRGEAKVVCNAYKNFSKRVENLRKKLDDLTTTLPSPLPSPDINAPSPSPESDIELPDDIPESYTTASSFIGTLIVPDTASISSTSNDIYKMIHSPKSSPPRKMSYKPPTPPRSFKRKSSPKSYRSPPPSKYTSSTGSNYSSRSPNNKSSSNPSYSAGYSIPSVMYSQSVDATETAYDPNSEAYSAAYNPEDNESYSPEPSLDSFHIPGANPPPPQAPYMNPPPPSDNYSLGRNPSPEGYNKLNSYRPPPVSFSHINPKSPIEPPPGFSDTHAYRPPPVTSPYQPTNKFPVDLNPKAVVGHPPNFSDVNAYRPPPVTSPYQPTNNYSQPIKSETFSDNNEYKPFYSTTNNLTMPPLLGEDYPPTNINGLDSFLEAESSLKEDVDTPSTGYSFIGNMNLSMDFQKGLFTDNSCDTPMSPPIQEIDDSPSQMETYFSDSNSGGVQGKPIEVINRTKQPDINDILKAIKMKTGGKKPPSPTIPPPPMPPSELDEYGEEADDEKPWSQPPLLPPKFPTWGQNWVDTPTSPPPYERVGFSEPVEFEEGDSMTLGETDTDLRSLSNHTQGDIDHRNLISLTSSPREDSPWTNNQDTDYRKLALAPKRGIQDDNVESVDMEMSSDEETEIDVPKANVSFSLTPHTKPLSDSPLKEKEEPKVKKIPNINISPPPVLPEPPPLTNVAEMLSELDKSEPESGGEGEELAGIPSPPLPPPPPPIPLQSIQPIQSIQEVPVLNPGFSPNQRQRGFPGPRFNNQRQRFPYWQNNVNNSPRPRQPLGNPRFRPDGNFRGRPPWFRGQNRPPRFTGW